MIIPRAVHLRAGQTDPHRPRCHSGGNVDEKRRAGTGVGQVRLEHDLIIHVGKPQREPVHRRVIRRGAVDDLEARERERAPQLHRPETARDIGGQAGGAHHAIQRVGGDVRGGGVAGLCDAQETRRGNLPLGGGGAARQTQRKQDGACTKGDESGIHEVLGPSVSQDCNDSNILVMSRSSCF